MRVILKKAEEHVTYLDPSNSFKAVTINVEKRYDPLTGDVSLLVPFKRFNPERIDWSDAVTDSLSRKCPFCPENRAFATPRFDQDFWPEGHIVRGNAVVVPNLSPYEKYSSVVIMSPKHYIRLEELSRDVIEDSFQAALSYLKICKSFSKRLYCSINWNYMPYSGGTLIHPHLQVIGGEEPTNYQRRCLERESRYLREHSSVFWNDLVAGERETGERFIGETDSALWMSAFAPRALADIIAVLPDCSSLGDVGENHVRGLAEGFLRIFPAFKRKNIPSFNFSLFMTGEGRSETVVTGRLVGRFPLVFPAGSDMSYLQVLHDTPWVMSTPEQLARELKPAFEVS
jgi:UDPglucose--hexose-1-phosphate uridylyltransferase